MAEAVKAMLAMVGAHAAGADAAEGQLFSEKMHGHIVHAHASGPCAGQDLTFLRAIGPKIIQCQRSGAAIHRANDLIHPIIGAHRQQRRKNFMLHDPHIVRGTEYQCGADQSPLPHG
jgi:hypothetical protein